MKAEERPSAWEWAALLGALLAFGALSCLDWSSWHPGIVDYDESGGTLAWLQLRREGAPLSFSVAQGWLHRGALELFARAFGYRVGVLHLATYSFFLIENILLFSLAGRSFGRRAAVWAVLCNLACAFTFVRERSLLSFSAAPAELLAMAWLMDRVKRPWAAFLWGCTAPLLTLDYEVWVYGAPLLLLAFWAGHSKNRISLAAAGAGALCGLAWVLALSWANLKDYGALRMVLTVPSSGAGAASGIGGGLKSFWLGGHHLPFLGPDGHPAFPPWALPALLLGIWAALRRWKAGVLWAAAAFLPLMLRNGDFEPQRAILAWPALCLLAGLGFSEFAARMPKRLFGMAAAALLLAGAAQEAMAMRASRARDDESTYGVWRQWQEATKDAVALSGGPERVMTETGLENGAAFRFLAGEVDGPQKEGPLTAILPWDYGFAARKAGGSILREYHSAPGHPPALLYLPGPQAAARLLKNEADLKALEAGIANAGPKTRRDRIIAWLESHPRADPWTRNVAWDRVLHDSVQLRDIPYGPVKQALAEPLVSGAFYGQMAELVADASPRQSLLLAEKALQVDPRRDSARLIRAEALRRLKLGPVGVR